MAVHKCCIFSLKTEKSFIAHPDACCALLALRSIQLMTGEPRPPVQRAPVTWREWGLCVWPQHGHLFHLHPGRQYTQALGQGSALPPVWIWENIFSVCCRWRYFLFSGGWNFSGHSTGLQPNHWLYAHCPMHCEQNARYKGEAGL